MCSQPALISPGSKTHSKPRSSRRRSWFGRASSIFFVKIISVSGSEIRLGITAPREVRVLREEIFIARQVENRAAANAPDSRKKLEDALKQLRSKTAARSDD